MTRLLTALGLALFLFLGWSMIRASAPTYDEPVHLASGYTALRNGTRLINAMDHPPLAEMWAALPLLVLRPALFFEHPDWVTGRVYNYSDFFLYKNRVDPERMLDTARLWCLLSWGLLLAWGILGWARRFEGAPAMAAGALGLGLCPPLFSNAALVTTDAGSAVFFFLTFRLLRESRRTPLRWLAAGVCMGAAMACKFNMFVLPFFVAAMLLAEWRLRRAAARWEAPSPEGRRSPRPKGTALAAPGFPVAGLAGALLAAVFVLAAVYRFWDWHLYSQGLAKTLSRLGAGRGSFFFGSHPLTGSIIYFPAALAVKTPLPLLLAAVAGLWALWRRTGEEQLQPAGLGRFLELSWLAAPPAAYFLLACLSKTQIGYRHILPVYPFLIVAAAAGAGWAWRQAWGKPAAAVLGIWLAASVLRCQPDYLAYFNESVGGPDQGYRCLVDSNLDWGQGLKPLAASLRGMGNPPVFLCYFGVADPSYYGIRYALLAPITNVDRREGVVRPQDSDRVLLAVSATNLQTTYYADHSIFDWLKTRRPLLTAGRSIFLYDLTDDAEGIRQLAGLVEAAGDPAEAAWLRNRHVHPA
jgi:hypothetical protein